MRYRVYFLGMPPHAGRPAATATEPEALPALEVLSGDRAVEAKARDEKTAMQ
jgi:hypothetical protein